MKTQNTNINASAGPGFIGYASPRIILAALLIVALIGGINFVLHHFDLVPHDTTLPTNAENNPAAPQTPAAEAQVAHDPVALHHEAETSDLATVHQEGSVGSAPEAENLHAEVKPTDDPKQSSPPSLMASSPPPSAAPEIPHTTERPHATVAPPATQTEGKGAHTEPLLALPKAPVPDPGRAMPAPHPKHPEATPPVARPHVPPPHATAPKHSYRPTGVAFVDAVMYPIDYELNQRFLGWRPNDIVSFADNAINFQLGVLEVTRRTAVQLTERISRTGSTDAFNPHLENAMNWLMVKSDRYWFPAPESKYRESLSELEAYKQNLISGTASFHTRADNLIPLLMAYEDLLGSSDENLVKHQEKDGSTVSTFKADNYFYYAQGIASTLVGILEAIHHDFESTLENRNGSELLHHAIKSCRIAADLDPLFITNSALDGFFANHRANMAAPISHARFYISQLIKTLST